MGATRSAAAGSNYAAIGFYDSDGRFLVGGTRTAPAAGLVAGSTFARIRGIKSGTPPANEPEATQITGDDGLVAEIDFTNIDTRRFTIEVAVQDLDLIAAADGTIVETVAGGKMLPVDTDTVPDRDAALILQSRNKNTVTGASGYSGVFIPRATVQYLGRSEATEREAAAYQFSVTPQLTIYKPWGVTLSNSTNGAEQARQIPFASSKPFWMHCWTGDGAETDFATQHDLVGAASLAVFVDRVQVAVDSISSNTITLASAPGSGRPIVALYQFSRFND